MRYLLVLLTAVIFTVSGCARASQRHSFNDELEKEVQKDVADSMKLAFQDLDYEEDIDNKKEQKIEIYTMEGTLLRTITDNREIYDYIKNQRMEEWGYLDQLSTDAKPLIQIFNWQEPTRTKLEPQKRPMELMSVDTLYADETGYYLQTQISVGISFSMVSKLPDDVGEYLVEVAKDGRIAAK